MQQAEVAEQVEPVAGSVPAPTTKEASSNSHAIAAPSNPRTDAPDPGTKFTDKDLRDRFGVRLRGGIRVSRENKYIVLVALVDGNTDYRNANEGDTVMYMGENHHGNKEADQVLDGNNLALSRSREEGYTVLYFTKQDDVLVFDKIVEYRSHRFKNEGASGRKVIFFELGAVGIETPARQRAAGSGAPGAALQGAPDLDMIETVECAISLNRSYKSRDRLLRALPERIDSESLDRVLGYLEHSGKIAIDGEGVRWTFSPAGSGAGGLSNSRRHDAHLASRSILGGTRFEYIEEGKLPTETVGDYLVRVYNADEPGSYTAKDARKLDKSMRRLARGKYYTREQIRGELGL